jgi:hypothetical protein
MMRRKDRTYKVQVDTLVDTPPACSDLRKDKAFDAILAAYKVVLASWLDEIAAAVGAPAPLSTSQQVVVSFRWHWATARGPSLPQSSRVALPPGSPRRSRSQVGQRASGLAGGWACGCSDAVVAWGPGTLPPPAPHMRTAHACVRPRPRPRPDFNSDGKADVAVVANPGTVNAFMGNGAGGFGAPAAAVPVAGAHDLVAADFNGDGKADLAVLSADPAPLVLAVLRGNGDGTFLT